MLKRPAAAEPPGPSPKRSKAADVTPSPTQATLAGFFGKSSPGKADLPTPGADVLTRAAPTDMVPPSPARSVASSRGYVAVQEGMEVAIPPSDDEQPDNEDADVN